MSFSNFNLQADFIKSIEAAGYQSPTPLQTQLIPLLGEKKSALVMTQSASGKTGAFLIPAMNYILENPAPEKRGARILILTSRRDRVSQINYTIKRLSSDHVMRFGFIVSGRPYQTQMRLMRRPLDIMIATPGRLNDLMSNGKADFSQLEMLIIDDLSSIYKKNLHGLVEKIIEQAGDDCSTLTFVSNDQEITEYAESLFPDAVQVEVEDDGTQAEQPQKNKNKPKATNNKAASNNNTIVVDKDLMPQTVHIADDYTHKIALMDHLMDELAGEPTIIYTATNKAAKILQENLANHGHAADLLEEIADSDIQDTDILIASDQQQKHLNDTIIKHFDNSIIHFDLPQKTEQYLKRLSRHQQKRDNAALLLVDGYNFNELKHIEKTIGKSLDQTTIPGLEPLNPFVNQSRARNKPNNNSHKNHGQKNNRQAKNTNQRNAKAKNTKGRSTNQQHKNKQPNSNNNGDSAQRRQRKGPFGRLNGGAQRKKSNGRDNKVGVSARGTGAPSGGRGWQSDFAEPQERKVERSKPVVIRYSKKRTVPQDKPEETKGASD